MEATARRRGLTQATNKLRGAGQQPQQKQKPSKDKAAKAKTPKQRRNVSVPDWSKIHAQEERKKQTRLEKLKKPLTKVEEFQFTTGPFNDDSPTSPTAISSGGGVSPAAKTPGKTPRRPLSVYADKGKDNDRKALKTKPPKATQSQARKPATKQSTEQKQQEDFQPQPSSLNAILGASSNEEMRQQQERSVQTALESVLTRERLEAHRRRRETLALSSVKPSPHRGRATPARSLLHASRAAQHPTTPGSVVAGRHMRRETLAAAPPAAPRFTPHATATGVHTRAGADSSSHTDSKAGSGNGGTGTACGKTDTTFEVQTEGPGSEGFEADPTSKAAIMHNDELPESLASAPARQTMCPATMRAAERRRHFFETTQQQRLAATPRRNRCGRPNNVHRSQAQHRANEEVDGSGDGAVQDVLRTPSTEHLRRAPKSPRTKPSLVSYKETLLTPHRNATSQPPATGSHHMAAAAGTHGEHTSPSTSPKPTYQKQHQQQHQQQQQHDSSLRLSVQKLSQSILRSNPRHPRVQRRDRGHIRSFEARCHDIAEEDEAEERPHEAESLRKDGSGAAQRVPSPISTAKSPGGAVAASSAPNTAAVDAQEEDAAENRRRLLQERLQRIRAEEKRLEQELLGGVDNTNDSTGNSDNTANNTSTGDSISHGGAGGSTAVAAPATPQPATSRPVAQHVATQPATHTPASPQRRFMDAYELVQQLRREIDSTDGVGARGAFSSVRSTATDSSISSSTASSGRSAVEASLEDIAGQQQQQQQQPGSGSTAVNHPDDAVTAITKQHETEDDTLGPLPDFGGALESVGPSDDEGEDDELTSIFYNAVTLTLQGAAPSLLEPRLPGDPVAEHLHQQGVEEDKELERRVSSGNEALPLAVFRPISPAATAGADSFAAAGATSPFAAPFEQH